MNGPSSNSRPAKRMNNASSTNKHENDVQPEPLSNEEDQDDFDDLDHDESGSDEFSTHQKMPPQHPATRTCHQLMDLMVPKPGEKPYLDLNPHYQRNVVWTRKAKQMLIDSMFEGFFVPPVIFNVTELIDENGQKKYRRTCVDGKQRLTSIRDFMRGRFPWKFRNKEWYFTTPVNEDDTPMLNAKNKPKLPEKKKQEFGDKNLLCVEYVDLTQTQEIELFQRVQLGKPLTKAETFKASQGPWQDLARVFEVDYAEIVNLPRQNNRASQFWSVLSCFSQIYECMDPSASDGVPRLKIRVPQIERLCSNEKSLDRKTKSHLRMVFDKFLELVHEDRSLFESSQYKTTKTFSPIELEGICCLLSQWGEQRPIGMLRGDIRLLRNHLRQRHSELRSSDAHWTTCWNYIDDLESIRGAVDGATVTKPRPAESRTAGLRTVEPQTIPISQLVRSQQTPQSTAAKRGRKPADSDDDQDFRPSATTKRAAGSGKRSKVTAPRATNNVPSYAINPDPMAFETEQIGLSDGDSSGSSPWDSDDEREQAERRARRAQKAQKAQQVEQALQAPTAPMGGIQPARKRALMDLGGNSNTARDLEAKKARVMATRVKQEE